PWELEDDATGAGSVAPGKQTLTARLPPKIGGLVDPTAAAAPGLGPIEGTGAKPAPPSDDAFAVHLETAKAKGSEPTDAKASEEAKDAETPAADAAAEAAAQAAALRQLLRADGRFLATYVDALDVTAELKIAPAAAALALSRFELWSELGKLSELVAEVRKHGVKGVAATLLQTDNAWEYLVAVLDKPARVRLYDCLADGNVDARNAGRFTEDIVEFWSVQMREDANVVKAAYRALADDDSGPAKLAVQRARIISTLAEYRVLDERYRMKGTLLTRFLQKIDVVVTLPGGLFGIGEEQTRMLDDIKRRMGPSLPAYMAQLDASNLVVAKQDAPELVTLGGSIAQDVQDAVLQFEAVADVVDFLLTAGKETAQDCLRWLARTVSKRHLLLDFIAEQFREEKLRALCAFGLSLLSGETIVEILQKIDFERLGEFYLALVTCTASVMFLPQLFAAYWLLPDKTRDKVFSALGRTAFEPLIREAKEYVVPILQNLIDRHLPVGVGIYSERGLTASVSYAVAGGDSSFSFTRTGPKTLRYDERFTLRGGAEYSRGAGMTEGKKNNGEQQKFWGHEAALTLGGKMEFTSQNQYEFPFLDDDAFVGLLCAFIDIEAAVSAGALVFEELDQIDPFPYLKKSKLEPKLLGEAQGVAQSGMREGKGGPELKDTWKGGEKPSEMGSSVGGPFGAQASARIGALLEVGGALEIERKEDQAGKSVHAVSVEVGLKGALSASANIPGLAALAATVPQADAGVAVKATWTIAGLVQEAPEQIGGVKLSLVGTTGDMDTQQGSASETEVELSADIDFDRAEDFIRGLGKATFKRRIGIASVLGRKCLAAINNQKNLSAQLKKEYEHVGIKLRGSIDLEFSLDTDAVREIAGIFLDLLRAAGGGTLDDLRDAAMTFLTSGRLPAKVEAAATRIGAILEAGLDDVKYHLSAGVAGAAGDVVGGVGGHAYAGAGLILQGKVADKLDALGADQLLDVVRGKLEDLGDMELDWTP
ncbi:MAG: hypothetical protein K8M05_33520, partial [Deltaproteobacteria bacterium]|nr:hypothetical protein [Kofleriaceae bacterium]